MRGQFTSFLLHFFCVSVHFKIWPYKRGDLSWGGKFTSALLSL